MDVVGIKVTRPSRETTDGLWESYSRIIRFELSGGDVLEVLCAGDIEQYIKLRSVKTLKSVSKPKPINWLTPKVYKGTSDRENA